MPRYCYKCAEGHEFSTWQDITADPLVFCLEDDCSGEVHRIIQAPLGINYKCGGFHNTDYTKTRPKRGR